MAKYERWIREQGLILLEGMARDGLTEEQIALQCGVTRTTLSRWKHKHPEVAQALRKGKEIVDRQVESALLKRALGYDYTEVTVQEGRKGTIRREITRHEPGSVRAQMFWLTNRQPNKWSRLPDLGAAAEVADAGIVVLPVVVKEDDQSSST